MVHIKVSICLVHTALNSSKQVVMNQFNYSQKKYDWVLFPTGNTLFFSFGVDAQQIYRTSLPFCQTSLFSSNALWHWYFEYVIKHLHLNSWPSLVFNVSSSQLINIRLFFSNLGHISCKQVLQSFFWSHHPAKNIYSSSMTWNILCHQH